MATIAAWACAWTLVPDGQRTCNNAIVHPRRRRASGHRTRVPNTVSVRRLNQVAVGRSGLRRLCAIPLAAGWRSSRQLHRGTNGLIARLDIAGLNLAQHPAILVEWQQMNLPIWR